MSGFSTFVSNDGPATDGTQKLSNGFFFKLVPFKTREEELAKIKCFVRVKLLNILNKFKGYAFFYSLRRRHQHFVALELILGQ